MSQHNSPKSTQKSAHQSPQRQNKVSNAQSSISSVNNASSINQRQPIQNRSSILFSHHENAHNQGVTKSASLRQLRTAQNCTKSVNFNWPTYLQITGSTQNKFNAISVLLDYNWQYLHSCIIYASSTQQGKQIHRNLKQNYRKVAELVNYIQHTPRHWPSLLKEQGGLKILIIVIDQDSKKYLSNYSIPNSVDFIIDTKFANPRSDLEHRIRKSISSTDKVIFNGLYINICNSAQKRQIASYLAQQQVRTAEIDHDKQKKYCFKNYFKQVPNTEYQSVKVQAQKSESLKMQAQMKKQEEQENLQSNSKALAVEGKLNMVSHIQIMALQKDKANIVKQIIKANQIYFGCCIIYAKDYTYATSIKTNFQIGMQQSTKIISSSYYIKNDMKQVADGKWRICIALNDVAKVNIQNMQIPANVNLIINMCAAGSYQEFSQKNCKISKQMQKRSAIIHFINSNFRQQSNLKERQIFQQATKKQNLTFTLVNLTDQANYDLSSYLLFPKVSNQKIQQQKQDQKSQSSIKQTKSEQKRQNKMQLQQNQKPTAKIQQQANIVKIQHLDWATYLLAKTQQQHKAGRIIRYINQNFKYFNSCIVYIKKQSKSNFIIDRLNENIKRVTSVINQSHKNQDAYFAKLESGQLKVLIITTGQEGVNVQKNYRTVPKNVNLVIFDSIPHRLEVYQQKLSKKVSMKQKFYGALISMYEKDSELIQFDNFIKKYNVKVNRNFNIYQVNNYLKKQVIQVNNVEQPHKQNQKKTQDQYQSKQNAGQVQNVPSLNQGLQKSKVQEQQKIVNSFNQNGNINQPENKVPQQNEKVQQKVHDLIKSAHSSQDQQNKQKLNAAQEHQKLQNIKQENIAQHNQINPIQNKPTNKDTKQMKQVTMVINKSESAQSNKDVDAAADDVNRNDVVNNAHQVNVNDERMNDKNMKPNKIDRQIQANQINIQDQASHIPTSSPKLEVNNLGGKQEQNQSQKVQSAQKVQNTAEAHQKQKEISDPLSKVTKNKQINNCSHSKQKQQEIDTNVNANVNANINIPQMHQIQQIPQMPQLQQMHQLQQQNIAKFSQIIDPLKQQICQISQQLPKQYQKITDNISQHIINQNSQLAQKIQSQITSNMQSHSSQIKTSIEQKISAINSNINNKLGDNKINDIAAKEDQIIKNVQENIPKLVNQVKLYIQQENINIRDNIHKGFKIVTDENKKDISLFKQQLNKIYSDIKNEKVVQQNKNKQYIEQHNRKNVDQQVKQKRQLAELQNKITNKNKTEAQTNLQRKLAEMQLKYKVNMEQLKKLRQANQQLIRNNSLNEDLQYNLVTAQKKCVILQGQVNELKQFKKSHQNALSQLNMSLTLKQQQCINLEIKLKKQIQAKNIIGQQLLTEKQTIYLTKQAILNLYEQRSNAGSQQLFSQPSKKSANKQSAEALKLLKNKSLVEITKNCLIPEIKENDSLAVAFVRILQCECLKSSNGYIQQSKEFKDFKHNWNKNKSQQKNTCSSILMSAIDKMVQNYDNLKYYQLRISKYLSELEKTVQTLSERSSSCLKNNGKCTIIKILDYDNKQGLVNYHLQTISNNINTILDKLSKIYKTKTDLEQANLKLDSKVDEFNKKNKELQSSITRLETENSRLITKNNELVSKLQITKAQIESLQSECKRLQSQFSNFKQQQKQAKIKWNQQVQKLNSKYQKAVLQWKQKETRLNSQKEALSAEIIKKIQAANAQISRSKRDLIDQKKKSEDAAAEADRKYKLLKTNSEQTIAQQKKKFIQLQSSFITYKSTTEAQIRQLKLQKQQELAKAKKQYQSGKKQLVLTHETLVSNLTSKQQKQTKRQQEAFQVQKNKLIQTTKDFINAVNDTAKATFGLQIATGLQKYQQQLQTFRTQIADQLSKTSFLPSSQFYRGLTKESKDFIYNGIKKLVPKKISYTKPLFEGSKNTSRDIWNGWLELIAGHQNILMLMTLENGYQIGAFSQTPFTKNHNKSGRGFLMGINNKKIYSLKQKGDGRAIVYDDYMVKFGNNELLIKSNLTFSIIFGKQFGLFDVGNDKITDFIGTQVDEGNFIFIQFHKIAFE